MLTPSEYFDPLFHDDDDGTAPFSAPQTHSPFPLFSRIKLAAADASTFARSILAGNEIGVHPACRVYQLSTESHIDILISGCSILWHRIAIDALIEKKTQMLTDERTTGHTKPHNFEF